MIAKRILLAVAAAMAVAVFAVSIAVFGNVLPAWAQDILPPAAPAPPTLGNPADLTAATAGRGEVNISFSPAAGATVHWVWRVRYDNTDGAYVKGATGGLQTVTGLKPGEGYYFIVIAGRPQATGGGMQWSSWSNWSAAAAGTAAGRTSPIFPANPVNGDYDHDDDHLIEIRSITQLDAIHHDLDGNGVADANSDDDDVNAAAAATYAAAFPNAAAGMGCPDTGCVGYELAASLDFQTGEDSGAWVPVRGYAADFDGNGLTISNLFIDQSNSVNVGLFGSTTSGSTVRRVGLEAANVIGNSGTGGLVGHNRGDIIDSYVKGSVSGNSDVGGLVGYNTGAVTKSYADATVLGRYGDSDRIGGLVGHNSGNINNSYAEGTVSGDDSIGGLVGYNGGAITAGYATAIASGNYYVGGLVGYNSNGSITAAYATGAAAGYVEVGGLVGANYGAITAAYATGTASKQASYWDAPGGGGLVGYGSGTKTHHSYWDTETSHWTSSAAGLGRTTAQLQTPTSNTGIYSQWDPAQWDFGTSTQYPVLDVDGLSVSAQRGGQDTTTQTKTETDAGAGTPATDRAALVAFYQATGGANWKNIPSDEQWLINDPGSPISNWHGVTTSDAGRVRAISLPDKGLKGKIPAELADLSELIILRLSRNRLSGEIPSELGSLSNLRWLDLSHNADRGKFGLGVHPGFGGELPMELGNLHNLRDLNLSGNSFEGDPTEVLLNIAQCNTNSACRDAATFIDIDLRDNSWSGEEGDFWLNFTGKAVQVARGKFGNAYTDFVGKNADSVIKTFLSHEALAGKYSRFNAWATLTESAIGKANFAAQIVDPLDLFGQDATVQKALWDVFILNKDWTDVRTAFLTSWGVAPENICWGGLVSANCSIYESLDSDVEWCKAIYGERAARCNQ